MISRAVKLLILSFLLILQFEFVQAQARLVKIGEYSITIDNERYMLPQMMKAVMDKDGALYYCDMGMVLKFDEHGVFLKELSPTGRGPGEFQTLIDCTVTDNYFIIYPFNEFKILFYHREDLSYSHEVTTGSFRSRYFSALNDSALFFLSDVERGMETFAINSASVPKRPENVLKKYNITPPMAYVGSTTQNAGGITNDGKRWLFYTFVSYSSVWAIDLLTDQSTLFEHIPTYFEPSELKELDQLKEPNDHRYYRGYMYSKSRTMGLFMMGNKVLQQIETGNPYQAGGFNTSLIQRYLEGWSLNGDKVFSGLKSPNNKSVAFTYLNRIYFNNGASFSEQSAELKDGERLPLFEIYEIKVGIE